MADKNLLLKEKVEESGLFDYSGLYGYAHGWLKENGYGVSEDKYSEKIGASSKDIDIEWKASKKITDYFKIEHSIKFEIKGMSDVEVEIDGKKKKTNKGKVAIEIKTILINDYKSNWESSPFMKFLRDIYDKYIIPNRNDQMAGQASGDALAFKEEMKAFLELSGRR
jgi:hypothetical protein